MGNGIHDGHSNVHAGGITTMTEYTLFCWWSGHDEPQLIWFETCPDERPWLRKTHHVFVGKRATVTVLSDEPVKREYCLQIATTFMSGNYRSFNLNEATWTQGTAH